MIVRARNEERTLELALQSLRRQSVSLELIVVDSGSTDRTPDIARRVADRVIDIPAGSFTYGRALNIGARAATARFHFALSAHCAVERADWIERSLAHYRRDDVAATNGLQAGEATSAVFYQDAAHARANPYAGFSNHASSWRASVWERFPFDEQLEYAEDKEWALRVLDAGWVIAFDPALDVDLSHVWRGGLVDHYRRRKKAARAIGTFNRLPPYGLRECLQEWWADSDDRRPAWRRRLNPVRTAGLIGKYEGSRTVAPDRPTRPSAGL